MRESPLNLHKLRVFCEVVERQSLTLAAEQLVVSQPVVSVHVRDLEAYFGARLLMQQGRRMVPTEAGEAVYRHALEVLRTTEETVSMVRALESGEAGKVAIGANMVPGTYLLPRTLTTYKLRHPSVDISLLVSDSTTVCDHMHRGMYDFAVIVVPEPPHGLHAEVIGHDDLVLVVSPRHPIAKRGTVMLDDLVQERWVCRPTDNARQTLVDAALRSIGFPSRQLEMTLSHPEAIKSAVAGGVGVALMFSCSVERELQTGELAEVKIVGQRLQAPIYLIHNRGKRFSPAQEQLLDTVRQRPGVQRAAPMPPG